MRTLTGILVFTILLSKCSASIYNLDDFDNAAHKRNKLISYLRRLLERDQLDNDENSLFRQRGGATVKKCGEIKTGTYYSGNTGSSIDNIPIVKDCMNECENDKICYGWSYEASTQTCWLQTSITGVITSKTYQSGSCIGLAAKEKKCKEILLGEYYRGSYDPAIKQVPTVQNCISKCNDDSTCLGWSYRVTDKTCWLQTTVYGKVTDVQYMGGSCIIPHAPYPPPNLETFRQQGLHQHNFYRSKHCTSPLVLNSSLNDIAQAYAEKLAANEKFEHSGNKFHGNSIGENIWTKWGSDSVIYTKGSSPVSSWYSEIAYYNWNNPGFSKRTGHFTQVIWKDTKAVGIGRAVTHSKTTMYVVANYYPAGNVGRGYESNVQKLC